MNRHLTLAAAAVAIAVLGGCAATPAVGTDPVSACRSALDAATGGMARGLNPDRIEVVTWNVMKGREDGWRQDLDKHGRDANLLLFQEASPDIGAALDAYHAEFVPGFTWRNKTTGVMTLADVRPIASCRLSNPEPLFRTPKTTSVAEYGLSGKDETLVVVNLHAINFALGTRAFRRQFEQVARVVRDHTGPLILAGDMNTWRGKRQQIVDEFAGAMDLRAVQFKEDQRSKFLGRVVDHVYVRGLAAQDATSEIVETSDHNPLSVTLGL